LLICRWADPWIGKSSQGHDWIVSRNVEHADLNSCPVTGNFTKIPWTIDIAIGFVLAPRNPCNISGELILYFKPLTKCNMTNDGLLVDPNIDKSWIYDTDSLVHPTILNDAYTEPTNNPKMSPTRSDVGYINTNSSSIEIPIINNIESHLSHSYQVVGFIITLLVLGLYLLLILKRSQGRSTQNSIVDSNVDESMELLMIRSSNAKDKDRDYKVQNTRIEKATMPTSYGSV